jgi:methyltransferase (TIGR00027 family)
VKEGRPSWTAGLMALFRAIESSRPPAERLFDDPFAAVFLSLPLRCVHALCRLPGGRTAVVRIIERRWGGPLGSAVCRTRYIDDALAAALGGVGQVVLLGAGFDCRAHRIPGIERTRVFEVDHPATQAAKRARLGRMLGTMPGHVTFVPVVFGRDRLEEAMARAGFLPGVPTFFLWEGVTNYLTAEAVDQTLRWVAGAAAAGSVLLFTYVHRGMLDGSVPFEGARAGSNTVRRSGEPFTFGFDPAELPAHLAARGLTLVEDVAAPEYRARYLGPAGREMKLWEFYRAAVARVT